MNNTYSSNIGNTAYTYKRINSAYICSDPAYQREIDEKRVKLIASHFNPNLVNPIKVSARDGKYFVFDGQHTLRALKLRNGNHDLPVECKVYTGLTQQDEARLFSEQGGIVRPVKTNAKMKALYTAGDVEIVELHRAINSQGIRFDFTNAKAPNKIVACTTIYTIFKKTTCSEFAEILNIIKESWNGEAESFNKEILMGTFIFYKAYKPYLNRKKIVRQFAKVSPQVIIREGKVFMSGGDKRFARQLLNAYNSKIRTGRLNESDLEIWQ